MQIQGYLQVDVPRSLNASYVPARLPAIEACMDRRATI